MTFIEHTRFVLDPETEEKVSTIVGEYSRVNYVQVFDHTDRLNDEDTTMERIQTHIKEWEQDHFGLISVYTSNDSEYLLICKRSNRQKFRREMLKMGLIVKKATKK